MNIKKQICRLREALTYTLKKIPIISLIEIWSITRVLFISISVIFLIVDNYLRHNSDTCIFTLLK
jgi:hypothetical protein